MGVNKYQPHLFILPEDDADRQIAVGFLQHPNVTKNVQALPVAGGWLEVIRLFEQEYAVAMDRNSNTHVALVIDFDSEPDRLDKVLEKIPERLRDRVFVVGAKTNPEDLRRQMGSSFETIGRALAKDCYDQTETTWGHELLKNNAKEAQRFREKARTFAFSGLITNR